MSPFPRYPPPLSLSLYLLQVPDDVAALGLLAATCSRLSCRQTSFSLPSDMLGYRGDGLPVIPFLRLALNVVHIDVFALCGGLVPALHTVRCKPSCSSSAMLSFLSVFDFAKNLRSARPSQQALWTGGVRWATAPGSTRHRHARPAALGSARCWCAQAPSAGLLSVRACALVVDLQALFAGKSGRFFRCHPLVTITVIPVRCNHFLQDLTSGLGWGTGCRSNAQFLWTSTPCNEHPADSYGWYFQVVHIPHGS